MWIGTQGSGLDRLVDPGAGPGSTVFRNYSERDGLPNAVINGIQSDAAGGIWLSTNHGLSRFDPPTESFKNYDVSNGLQGNEFNVAAHSRTSGVELLFGGVNGFSIFHPELIVDNASMPPVVLTAFLKFNQPVALDELQQPGGVQLRHD